MISRLHVHRRWIYLGLSAVLVLDLLVFFGWIRNPDLMTDADPAQVAILEQEVALFSDEVARLKRIQESVPQMGATAADFKGRQFLADADGYRRIGEDLTAAARASGVLLARLDSQERIERDRLDLKRVEMTSDIEGSYGNLLRFMDILERSPQLYLLTELSFVGSKGGLIRVQLELVTYFRRTAT